MRTFKVTLVDFSNPGNSITREVDAENYRQAMRSAQAHNEGFLAVEAEAVEAPARIPAQVARIPAMAS